MKIEPTSPQNSRRQFIENTVREELNIQDNIPTKTLLERLDEITLRVEETRLTATNSNDEKTLYNLAKKVFRDGDQSRFSVTCINELLNMIDQIKKTLKAGILPDMGQENRTLADDPLYKSFSPDFLPKIKKAEHTKPKIRSFLKFTIMTVNKGPKIIIKNR